jgi:hypothetical protein
MAMVFLALSIYTYGKGHATTAKGMVTVMAALLLIGLMFPMWGVDYSGATPPSNATDYIPVTYIFEKSGSAYYAFSDKTDTLVSGSGGTDFDNLWDTVISVAASGDSIYFKPAAYYTNDELVVSKQLRIYSDGYYTQIIANGAIDAVFQITASYVQMEQFTVDSNGYANIGVWINGGSRVELTKIEATDALVNNFEISFSGVQRTGSKLDRCIGAEAGQYNLYIGDEQTDNWVTGCTFKDSDYSGTDAGIAVDGSGQQFMNNHVWGNKYGYLLAPNNSIVRWMIIGDYIESNTDANIYNAGTCHSAYDGTIQGCVFWANAEDRPEYDIQLDCSGSYYSQRLAISGNVFQGQSYADTAIVLGDHARNNVIQSNTINGYDSTFITMTGSGIYNTVSQNTGFVTEGHGLAVLTANTTSVVVTHGLSYTPYRGDISIVLSEFVDDDGSYGDWYISATDATTFTLNVHHAPTIEDISYYWSVSRVRSYTP